jgi:predicted secreted protein
MERMEKQTAVKWLANEIQEQLNVFLPGAILDEIMINKANEMFEQQMIDAWNNGFREFYDGSSTPEEYYNKTFKTE